MRRTTPLTTAALLGLALFTPATAATAAGETCRGEAATIVGTGPTVTGTEGRDVIITGPATQVDALGGNDLVCVTGSTTSSDFIDIDAGTGDDVVDTTAVLTGHYVATVLGAGADTFVGGRADDSVYAGEQVRLANGGFASGSDTETDTIDTGDAGDGVFSGSPGTPTSDVIRLGTGVDQLYLSSAPTPAAVLDGGEGDDGLRVAGVSGDLAIDMAQGTLTSTEGAARFASIEHASVLAGPGTLTYRGTEGDDNLVVHPTGGAPTLDLTTGGGDDRITLEPAMIAAGSRLDAGSGDDRLIAATETGRLALDLPAQRLTVGAVDAVAFGLEGAFLLAPQVVAVGDDRDNQFSWDGCDADLRGKRGDDSLRWQYDYVFESYEFSCTGTVRMNGGDGNDSLRGSSSADLLVGERGDDRLEGRGGNDRIRGGSGADRMDGGEGRDDVQGGSGRDVLNGQGGGDTLLGGSGRDRADGSNGRDRCVAEREARCER